MKKQLPTALPFNCSEQDAAAVAAFCSLAPTSWVAAVISSSESQLLAIAFWRPGAERSSAELLLLGHGFVLTKSVRDSLRAQLVY